MNSYADLSNPEYVKSVYQSLQSAGSTIGTGWESAMQMPTQQPQGGGMQAGMPQPGFGSGSGGGYQNMPGTLGPQPPAMNMPQQGFPQPSYQNMPGPPQGQSYGQPPQTQFDGNFWQQQTGPNTFTGGYGGGPQQGAPQQPSLLGPAQGGYAAPYQDAYGQPYGQPQQPQRPMQPPLNYGNMGSTYGVSQPIGGPINNSSPYGLPQGPLQGNILQVLQALGYPELGTARAMMGGGALGRTNVAESVQGLGGGSMLSPQSLQGMTPSGQEYFTGLIETILGMPMADYLQGAYQPFQGLGKGKKSRTRSATKAN